MPRLVRTLVATLRPPFLLLTLSCVALGLAAARAQGVHVSAIAMTVVLLGALAAHAAVNVLNEWHDFRSGLDAANTERTPFSGGSGALPVHPAAAPATLMLGLALLAVTAGVGLWLLATRGVALLPVGLSGLALVVAYTPWITRHPWACLLAPGLGFGPLMVLGTEVALTGRASSAGAMASLVPLALVSGLLLLNQFPDVAADRRVGRRHLPMLWGRPRAARVLAGLIAAALAVPPLAVAAGVLPLAVLGTLGLAPLAWQVARGALRHADDLPALLPVMGRNVALCLAMPLLLAALWWAATIAA